MRRRRGKQGHENAFKGPLRDLDLHHPPCRGLLANRLFLRLRPAGADAAARRAVPPAAQVRPPPRAAPPHPTLRPHGRLAGEGRRRPPPPLRQVQLPARLAPRRGRPAGVTRRVRRTLTGPSKARPGNRGGHPSARAPQAPRRTGPKRPGASKLRLGNAQRRVVNAPLGPSAAQTPPKISPIPATLPLTGD